MPAITVAHPTKTPPMNTFAMSPNRACWNIIRKPAQMIEIEQITPPTPSRVVWIVLRSVLTWDSCAQAGEATRSAAHVATVRRIAQLLPRTVLIS